MHPSIQLSTVKYGSQRRKMVVEIEGSRVSDKVMAGKKTKLTHLSENMLYFKHDM